MRFASAWMVEVERLITFSRSGFGEASNMRTCICMITREFGRGSMELVDILSFITIVVSIRHLIIKPLLKYISNVNRRKRGRRGWRR
jgi:hypothetical protein